MLGGQNEVLYPTELDRLPLQLPVEPCLHVKVNKVSDERKIVYICIVIKS